MPKFDGCEIVVLRRDTARRFPVMTKTVYLKVLDSLCDILHIPGGDAGQDWRVGVKEQIEPAIAALQQQLTEQERKVSETKMLINRLCEVAGLPPAYADVGGTSGPSIATLRGDTFYGKVMTTAAREYLQMRKAASLGPTTVRDIYENLKKGGYPFETEDANNAMTGIRQVLRKNSAIFHRLPNGEWGLLAWYERIKQQKQAKAAADAEIDEEDDTIPGLEEAKDAA